MTPREFGLSIGYQQGQTIEGAELRAFERQYEEYRKQAVAGWEMSKDQEGNLLRVNPHTGLAMVMTNQAGQPVKAANNDPFAGYMNPSGVAGATVDTNSAAFSGVQPSPMPAAAPAGNPVTPVNVNPAVPTQTAGGGDAAATGAAAPAPAPTPVANRVRVTAAEFEQTYGRKVQPGTAFPYKNEQGQTIAIIEVE